MTLPESIEEFERTYDRKQPPINWPRPLSALWWDAKDNWEKAHDLVDGSSAPMADAVHAYLHRKEGDEWNANYWYDRAKQPFFDGSLEEEFETILLKTINYWKIKS